MYLGIDIGTSGVKAIVAQAGGGVVGQATAPLVVSRPHRLWSEQDPQAWWSATCAAVQALDPTLRRQVKAIGLGGQMHGATLLGEDDLPLRPAILWNDGRSYEQCAELKRRAPDLERIAANLAMPGFTAPKLLWVREHEPEVFARTRSVLLPKDYVRLLMTGDKCSDMSDASGTLWLDVAARRWSEALLAACGLSLANVPRLVEGSEVAGVLRAEIAAVWGMDVVPVVGGGGDNAAGAAGVGVVTDGSALLSLGTSGVIFAATDTLRPDPARAVHAFCHCLPDMWHQMSVHLSAASCIDWVARLTGAAGPSEVFQQAEGIGVRPGPSPLFLPYLSGERTPHNDQEVRAGFLQLDNDTDAPALCQAVLEGVAFALADGLDALQGVGPRIDELSVIGGGARSRYWGRILSAALQTPLAYFQGGEVGPALGAARLAQIGVDGGDPVDVCRPPPVEAIIAPAPADVEVLAPRLAAFRQTYPRIRPHHEVRP